MTFCHEEIRGIANFLVKIESNRDDHEFHWKNRTHCLSVATVGLSRQISLESNFAVTKIFSGVAKSGTRTRNDNFTHWYHVKTTFVEWFRCTEIPPTTVLTDDASTLRDRSSKSQVCSARMSNILRVRRSSSIRREISKRGVLVSETGLWEYPSGPLTIISAVRVRQQPLTHWSMPTHAASLSPFLVPLTPRRQPHSFRERSSRFVAPPSSLSLSLSLSSSSSLSHSHTHSLTTSFRLSFSVSGLRPSFSFSSVALYRFISHRTL